ncbi:MAG: helix-hairpin-helix domain-containing protein [Bacteroidales bacterium]|nr:helix-hairpin-helix domain-containing protein [Bacteroidales bacterium]
MKTVLFFCFVCANIITFVYADIDPIELLEKTTEEMFQDNEAGEENVEFIEALEHLKEVPLNINSVSKNSLEQLYFLSNEQIDAIIRYRNDYGRIIGAHELSYIPFLDEKTVAAIEPYIYFGSEEDKKWNILTALKKGKHSALFRYGQVLRKSKAYKEKIYAGNPSALLARYNLKFSDNLKAGFALEKDAGEKNFDFFSGYVSFGKSENSVFREWIVGTYKTSFGYGLGMGSGGIFGSISNPDISVRPSAGIRPYSSGGETGFFSGTALRINPTPQTEISLFYGNNLLDAAAEASEQDSVNEIYDVATSTGYHRTSKEIAKRKAIRRQVAGIAIEHYFKRFRLGFQVNYTFFDENIKQEIKLYNRYNYLPSEVLQASIYYQWLCKQVNFFGEIASVLKPVAGKSVAEKPVAGKTEKLSIAFLQGLQWNVNDRFKMIFYYRYYPRNYASYYASAPGRSSNSTNEKGFNFRASLVLYKNWKMTFQTDHYSRFWFSYPEKLPYAGHDYKVELGNYDKKITFYTYYRYRIENEIQTHRLRLHFSYSPSELWTFATRIELNNFSKGVLAYQEIKYSFKRAPLRVSARISLFDTKGYDNRIYAYESDVLYGFSIPALYDRGTRFYFLATYKPLRWLSFWLRYAHTFMDNRYSFGSGNDLIEGRYKPEIKAQVRVTW